MKRRVNKQQRGDPFTQIERAADEAADAVLEEDRLLRVYGIAPKHGRSR